MEPEQEIESLERLMRIEQEQYEAMRAALKARIEALAADADKHERWMLVDQIDILQRQHEDVMHRIEARCCEIRGNRNTT